MCRKQQRRTTHAKRIVMRFTDWGGACTSAPALARREKPPSLRGLLASMRNQTTALMRAITVLYSSGRLISRLMCYSPLA